MPSTTILSDNGASSGTAGLKSTAGNDGVLILQTTTSGGTATNAVYADNYQNLGFGSAPNAWRSTWKALDVYGSTGYSGALYGNAGGATTGQIGVGQNWVYDRTSGNNLRVSAGAASDYYQYQGTHIWSSATSSTAGSTISFSQVLGLGLNTSLALQGATSQSGTGISFPATQSAVSDANTLDDYEEGTWTPVMAGSSSNPTVNGLSNTQGYYVKIGKTVWLWWYLSRSSITGGSGSLRITGLPFAASATDYPYQGVVNWESVNTGANTMPVAFIGSTRNFIEFAPVSVTGGTWSAVQISTVSTVAGGWLTGSISYQASS